VAAAAGNRARRTARLTAARAVAALPEMSASSGLAAASVTLAPFGSSLLCARLSLKLLRAEASTVKEDSTKGTSEMVVMRWSSGSQTK